MSDTNSNYIELAADIVSAYVSNNSIAPADLPALIGDVHAALLRVSSGPVTIAAEPLKPAVSARRSVHDDYLICLEDGKSLPADYPMVAPNYAKARSQLARDMGLGQKRKRVARGK